jgi:predicted HTH domain antitoxin
VSQPGFHTIRQSAVLTHVGLLIYNWNVGPSMSQIVLDIPEQSLDQLAVPREAAGQELRLLAALKLFEMQKISSGAAAELAGIPRVAFLSKLGSYGISTFRLTKEELEAEARLA